MRLIDKIKKIVIDRSFNIASGFELMKLKVDINILLEENNIFKRCETSIDNKGMVAITFDDNTWNLLHEDPMIKFCKELKKKRAG